MNLYEPLPDSVTVEGKNYKVYTDFRRWLKLISDIKNNSEIKYNQYYIGAFPRTADDAIYGILQFFSLGENKEKQKSGVSKKKKNVISFEVDAPFIASAFLQCYQIDLFNQKLNLHWWKFRYLLDGLPEDTEIKKRIMYRSIDLSTIRDKKERAKIRKIQNEIALPQEVLSDYEIGNAF